MGVLDYPLARMHMFQAFKLGIFLIASSKCVSALNCVACSHDPSSSSSSDLTCVGNLDGHPDVVVIECNPEYGDQVCYTMVNCGWYETWHTRCDTDSCNNKEPWTNKEDSFFS